VYLPVSDACECIYVLTGVCIIDFRAEVFLQIQMNQKYG